MEQQQLIPHLFRTEFTKITSVLCKHFGIEHLELAEDIASETFLAALETWSYNALPQNPTAWLHAVAKNKARNYMKRQQLFKTKVTDQLKHDVEVFSDPDIDLSGQNISDSQLQMLFAICHPSIPTEAQIGLALRILCGFGIDEIATALLSNKESINKRLYRAREKLRTEKVAIEFPSEDGLQQRLDTVLTTLYLLFSEGYYSESNDTVLRKDLCLEAMRLTYLLLDHSLTNTPAVNALLALMCFHASRFDARQTNNGSMILYHEQDETLWDKDLIEQGVYFLHQASQSSVLSKYHLEAGIAYWHTIKNDTHEKWNTILQLYDQLLAIDYSPVAALNRTYSFARVAGNAAAIEEAGKFHLTGNHFYYTLLGELYTTEDVAKARSHFEKALSLAKTQTDKQTIQGKLDAL